MGLLKALTDVEQNTNQSARRNDTSASIVKSDSSQLCRLDDSFCNMGAMLILGVLSSRQHLLQILLFLFFLAHKYFLDLPPSMRYNPFCLYFFSSPSG